MDEKKYSLEDIETLRARSDVSYEEAVFLLDKYDGDITRALIELEKRGAVQKGIRVSFNGGFADTLMAWWRRGIETRLIVDREDRVLCDLPVLMWIVGLIVGWRLIVVAAIIALVSGCHVRLKAPAGSMRKEKSPVTEPVGEAAPADPAPDGADPAVSVKPDETEDGYRSVTVD